MKRLARPVAFVMLLAPLLAPVETEAGAEAGAQDASIDAGTGWVATRMDADVTPSPDSARLRVEGTLRLRLDAAASRGPALTLNTRAPWLRLLRVETPGASAVRNDSIPGKPGILVARLRLATPAEKGAEMEVKFVCEGEAEGDQIRVRPGIALASWVEGWYPSPLSSKADETGDPVAVPGTTRFHLPRTWHAVSNGRRISSGECDGGACEEWSTDRPVMRSFSAAPYRVTEVRAGALDVGIYSLGASPRRVEKKAAVLARALEAMERRFGPYPYPTYAIVEVPEDSVPWSASSEQGFILVKTSILDSDEENLPLFAHEAAHGWWGNLVGSKDPGAKFCSEALAEYSAVTAIEALEGGAAAADFLEYSREGYNPLQSALGYFYMWRDGGDKPLAELAGDKWDHNLADSKGAWVWHMLRGLVGDGAFFETLRGVLRDYAGSSISVRDLEEAFAKASPGRDVRGFFDQWIDRGRAPILDLDWWSVDRGKGIEVHVRQLQDGEPFRLRLPIDVTRRGGGVTRDTLDISARESTHRLTLPDRALSVAVDPDRSTLLWRPPYGPRPESKDPR